MITCQVQTVNAIGRVRRIIMVVKNTVSNLVSHTFYKSKQKEKNVKLLLIFYVTKLEYRILTYSNRLFDCTLLVTI